MNQDFREWRQDSHGQQPDSAVRGGPGPGQDRHQRPDNDTLLRLYAYYKQATVGDAGDDRPGAFDFVARAKFDAWAELKGKTSEEAVRGYIFVVAGMDFD